MRPLTPSGRPRARGLPPPPAGPSPLPAEAGARGRGSDLPGVSPQRRAPDRAARGPRLCPGPGPAALRARPCAGHTPAAFLRWRPLRVSVFACSCLAARPFRGAFRAPPARSLGVVTELRTAPRVRSASPRLCRPGQGPCAKPLPRGAGECRPGRLDRPGPSGEGLAAMTAASRQRALWVPTLWPAGWALAIGYLSGALPRWGWRCGARHSSGAGGGRGAGAGLRGPWGAGQAAGQEPEAPWGLVEGAQTWPATADGRSAGPSSGDRGRLLPPHSPPEHHGPLWRVPSGGSLPGAPECAT